MRLDEATIWTTFLVFVRCSAMLLASPVFGANNLPVRIRVYIGFLLAISLTFMVRPSFPGVPTHVGDLAMQAGQEAICGLLLGSFFHLILHTAQMAGSILDLQLGLGMSQVMNPLNGVSVTVVSQFKYMLAGIIFLSADGHHALIRSLVESYAMAPPGAGFDVGAVMAGSVDLLARFSILALQIAAPVFAVSLVVDAALGLVGKAVPQMQVFLVGAPAKTMLGLALMGFTLPALTTAVRSGIESVAVGVSQAMERPAVDRP